MFKEKYESRQAREKIMCTSMALSAASWALLIPTMNHPDQIWFYLLAGNCLVGISLGMENLIKAARMLDKEHELKSAAEWAEKYFKPNGREIILGDDGEIEGFINRQEDKTSLTLEKLLEEK